ncbi:hypothetical protein Tsubulata_019469 [Turnera subulata]|uniref:DUF6737 domain-containing protein n=1 Tax=Turnera subulata TaxID=218843 RepID=A0A9Q0G9G8_9ROSI|nr:hypothetical protein Tsubulata_019469 [Turnera subulata]
MSTLSLVLPLSLHCSPGPSHPSSRTHLYKSTSWPKNFSSTANSFGFRGKTVVVYGGNSGGPSESQFLDESGIVDDMDGYLNYLSLEYDSSIVVTTIVSLLICSWWYIFLYSYPKEYSDMIAERRKKVSSGVEDTFGSRKSQ